MKVHWKDPGDQDWLRQWVQPTFTELTGAVSQLFVIAEAYPDLKATEQFRHLQSQLAEAETRICQSLRCSNVNVREMNTATMTFPTSIFANTFGFTTEKCLEIDDPVQRDAVGVKMSRTPVTRYDGDMRLFESPGCLKRFRRTNWEFQHTFVTPSDDLARFVDVIVSAIPTIQTASTVFQQVVMGDPQYRLPSVYKRYSLPQKWYGDNLTIEASGAAEVRELLEAVLSEWIDFAFLPKPGPFVIYADHDEYTTFFAHRKGPLNRLTDALMAAGFRDAEYTRIL